VKKLLPLMAAGLLAFAAPPAALEKIDEAGYTKLVAGQKGKVVLVNFWATWCEPCRAEMPMLAKLSARLKARGFELLTISSDEPEDADQALRFLSERGINGRAWIENARDNEKFINFIDPKWSGALPALIIYDRAGRKVKSYVGEADLKAVEAEISRLL
jgi:thiol-disulfide isomerase/thioredoxin